MTLLDDKSQDMLYAFVNFTSKGYDDDGVYHVRGLATDASLDLDGQRCDPEWLAKAMPGWAEWGNLREMHGSNAIGTGVIADRKGSGWIIEADIVDPLAATKIDKGVYKGFSIGIKNYGLDTSKAALELAPNGIINKGDIIEISAVDRPANPNAKLELAKSLNGTLTKIEAPVALESVATGAPCVTCAGFGRVKNEGGPTEDFHTCPDCGGSGNADDSDNSGTNIRPSNASGDQDNGEVGDDLKSLGIDDADKFLEALIDNADLAKKVFDAVKGDAPECDTCDGTGKIRDGHMKCPDCDGTGKVTPKVAKRQMSSKEINDLPDSDFAYIERGGTKDSSGRTVPRSKRHFPINDAAHVRNALARAPQSPFGDKAMPKIKEAAEKFGIEVSDKFAKAIAAELSKLVANNSEWMHDPDLLNTVREGIATFISQEADAFACGSDELWDLSVLIQIADGFTTWWQHEAAGGETPAPFTQGDTAMSFTGFGVEADLEKRATAEDATDEDKEAYKSAVLAALGVDDKIATEKTAREELGKQVVDLTAELERVKTIAAPRGIALRATQEQKAKAAQRETLLSEAKSLRDSASVFSDPSTRSEFIKKAVELEEQAASIQEQE